jgi:hypothetical protein
MHSSNYITPDPALVSWTWISKAGITEPAAASSLYPVAPKHPRFRLPFAPLRPLRQWLDNVNVHNAGLAHLICKTIPAQCPFERDVKLFGRTILHIPPMCKLNPLYEEVVGLRFRALCYLADECGEDITPYC